MPCPALSRWKKSAEKEIGSLYEGRKWPLGGTGNGIVKRQELNETMSGRKWNCKRQEIKHWETGNGIVKESRTIVKDSRWKSVEKGNGISSMKAGSGLWGERKWNCKDRKWNCKDRKWTFSKRLPLNSVKASLHPWLGLRENKVE